MQEKLVIYLHAHDLEHPSWAVLTADGLVRQSEAYDNALGFAQIAEDKEVIVIVPAEEVLLTAVTLPKMNRSRLVQAIPFALEENIIDDVNEIHFAAGEYQTGTPLTVAIVSRAKMESWISLLKSWSLQADLVVPASLALPVIENNWQVMLHDVAIVRMAAAQGFACDQENLAELINIALSEIGEQPETIHINNYTSTPFAEETARIKETMHDAKQFIGDLAQNAVKHPVLNLLQGTFAAKKSKFPRRDKLWKTAIFCAATWLVLLFLYPTVSYFILKQRTNKLNTQIAQIYKRNFPQSTSIVAPKLRMEEKLQKLSSEAGENHLLILLGQVGKAMHETANIKLKRFDFQNNQLNLELMAGSSDDFSEFTNYLAKQGLKVKQQNANLTGSRLNATLQIE